MRLKRYLLRSVILLPGLALLLAACLGEPALPALEADPAPTLPPPPANATVAAAPRLSLSLNGQAPVSNQPIPQIPHDLICRSDCLMCHKQGVGGAPRIPDAHRGLESSACQTCHVAPAGAQLSGREMYARVCARCHGEQGQGGVGPALNLKPYLRGVTDADLRAAIVRGRGASEMLAWGDLGLLSERQIDEIVALIRAWEPTAPEPAGPVAAAPASAASGDPVKGQALFAQLCTGCHGLSGEIAVGEGLILREAAGSQDDATLAGRIRDGGAGMPPFHALLTTNDINNLLALMRTWGAAPASAPTAIAISGREVFARVCARCHGQNGDGGVGPPLNSKEFLAAYDDEAVRQWIERGTLGTSMLSWGDLGLLTSGQIDELVAFIRAWQPDAPSTAGGAQARGPADAARGDAAHGQQLFAQFCSGCHGLQGERQTGGVTLNSAAFLSSLNDELIASQIQNGGRQMPSFHAVLTGQDVNDLLAFMRAGFTTTGLTAVPAFAADLLPIFEQKCAPCHGTLGGWSAATYDSVLNSGQHTPVVVPGDPDNSLLVQKLRGTQTTGGPMPPGAPLAADEIELVVRWVQSGAPDN
ncbi:MAG: c-type cytochrome [Chloroflexi bacterium]|nr:c-type cytochrome [Chloroflexota bacterium]